MTITDILDALGVEYVQHGEHHHAGYGWVQTDCPQCSPGEGRYRLGLNVRSFACNCWQCGRIRLGTALCELSGLPWQQVSPLVKDLDRELVEERFEGRRGSKVTVPNGMVDKFETAHYEFLRRRRFRNVEDLKRLWSLGGIGKYGGLMNWRVFIPVHYGGKLVSWTTRSISDETRSPYISARPDQEILPLKSLLYGEDYVRNTVIVVEGPLDVWAVGPGAVCTFGTAYTQEQLLRLSKYPNRYVLFDAEGPAQRKAEELVASLSVFDGTTTNVVLDSGKDPSRADSAERRQIRELLAADATFAFNIAEL